MKTINKRKKSDLEFIKKLSEANAIAGNEQQVRDLLYSELKTYCSDVSTDRLGSLIFNQNCNSKNHDGNIPRIMLAAHMDEVGWTIQSITEQGQLILQPVGGVKPLAQFMQKVKVTTEAGKKYMGIIQGTFDTTLYETKYISTAKFRSAQIPGKTYVDLGLKSAEEVRKLGIAIGDMVTYPSTFETLSSKNLICGKAFDDRLGCYVATCVMQNLEKLQHENNVYFAATTSEEICLIGAKTTSEIIKPDIAIVVDATCHYDEFDRSSSNNKQIGQGPILIHNCKHSVANKVLVEFIKSIAAKHNIPLQHEMLRSGGTDVGNIYLSNGGVPTVAICIPLRYGHCAYSIADTNDIKTTVKLVTELVLTLNSQNISKIKKFI